MKVYPLHDTLECFKRILSSDVEMPDVKVEAQNNKMWYKLFDSCGSFLLDHEDSSEEMKRLLVILCLILLICIFCFYLFLYFLRLKCGSKTQINPRVL